MGANAGHVKSAGAATPKGAGPGNLAGAKTLDGRSKLVLFFKPNFEALEITLFFRLFFFSELFASSLVPFQIKIINFISFGIVFALIYA